tara:strand:+ start:499 stop:621 length:123 start_codon:yes stop_codon:yes gene_type:complete
VAAGEDDPPFATEMLSLFALQVHQDGEGRRKAIFASDSIK